MSEFIDGWRRKRPPRRGRPGHNQPRNQVLLDGRHHLVIPTPGKTEVDPPTYDGRGPRTVISSLNGSIDRTDFNQSLLEYEYILPAEAREGRRELAGLIASERDWSFDDALRYVDGRIKLTEEVFEPRGSAKSSVQCLVLVHWGGSGPVVLPD